MKRFNISEFVSNEETPVVTKNGKKVVVMLPFIMDSDKPVVFLCEGDNGVYRATADGIETLETELYFKPQTDLPETWEEALHKFKETVVYYIDDDSIIMPFSLKINTEIDIDDLSNIIASKEEANAFLSFMKLRLIRKAWVGDFDATSEEYEAKYEIKFFANEFRVEYTVLGRSLLSFPTKEMAGQFLDLFKNLLDETRPLFK